jgi:hypothetical protein
MSVKQTIFVIIAALITGLLSIWLSNNIAELGKNIPSDDIYIDYLIGFLWAAVITVLLISIPFNDRIPFIKIWVIKIVVVLIIMLFYEHHYGLDAYTYYYRAVTKNIDSIVPQVGTGTDNIVRLNVILVYIAGNSYHGIKVIYSFIGLIGIYFFYRAATKYLGSSNIKIFYILALYPSILFWSSILGKDPLILFILGIYAFNVVFWLKERNNIYLIMAVCVISLSLFIRGWIAFIGAAPLILVAILKIKHSVRKYIALIITIGFSLWAWDWFMNYFGIETSSDIIEMTNKISGSWAHGGSAQYHSGIGNIKDMIVFLPLGAFTALFRPLIWEAHNIFSLISGIENTLLMVFVLVAMKRFKFEFIKQPIVIWGFSLLVVWTSMYAFVSYQNLGSAVRFKLQIRPFLILLITLIVSKQGRVLISKKISQ